MSATDELRRLLDERGVEYEGDKDVTRFFGHDGFEVVMQEDVDGKLDCLTPLYLTPEQAVEATLGRGTCNSDETDTWECVRDDLGGYGKTLTVHVMECTECGHTYEHVNGSYEFCPRCGRKVVDA